jgi:hypothetical protein
MQDPISKITKAKRAGGMAQVIECLALSVNPSTTLPPKRKKIEKIGILVV